MRFSSLCFYTYHSQSFIKPHIFTNSKLSATGVSIEEIRLKELSRSFGATAVGGRLVACLIQVCVSYKGFVSNQKKKERQQNHCINKQYNVLRKKEKKGNQHHIANKEKKNQHCE
jgi:hypothetical protein